MKENQKSNKFKNSGRIFHDLFIVFTFPNLIRTTTRYLSQLFVKVNYLSTIWSMPMSETWRSTNWPQILMSVFLFSRIKVLHCLLSCVKTSYLNILSSFGIVYRRVQTKKVCFLGDGGGCYLLSIIICWTYFSGNNSICCEWTSYLLFSIYHISWTLRLYWL